MMKYLLLVIMIAVALVVAGCGGETVLPEVPQEAESPEETPEETPEAEAPSGPLMGKVDAPLSVDGSNSGYPAEPLTLSGAVIYLAHDGSNIYVYMEAEVEGYLAVGLNNRGVMDGANMIFGYLDGAAPAYRNDLGKARTHGEVAVPAVGEFYLSRSDGKTVMEFSYPLTFPAGQGYNLEQLTPGETYSLIVATHRSSDDVSAAHTSRGNIDFTVQP
jgi:hypothetical protein